MPDPAVALIDGHIALVAAVRARLIDYLRALWAGLGSYNRPDLERFAVAVAPVVAGAQIQAAALTDSYLTLYQQTVGKVPARPVGIPRAVATGGRGVPPLDLYRRPGPDIWGALKDGVDWAEAVDRGLTRAVSLAETDVQLAETHAARHHMAGDTKVVGYRRVLTGASSCGLCAVASTRRYHKKDLLPIHPGCVPSGTIVVPPPDQATQPTNLGSVKAATRRWYTGELVTLRTRRDYVTVTPNHPVLTQRGWVPAELVRPGDDLFSSLGSHRAVRGGPHESQTPTLIEDVWGALAVTGVLLKVPLSPEDLHGDGADTEIDVVWANGNLPTEWDTTLVQPPSELLLVGGHRTRRPFDSLSSLATLRHTCLPPSTGFMRGRGLLSPLFDSHQRGPVQPSSGTPTRFDAPAEQFSLDSAPTYASRGLDLQRRLAGQVEPDRVVETSRVGWSGHVYNLHTADGWYQARSHIVSNCDCKVAPIYGDRDPGQTINRELADRLGAEITDRFGDTTKGSYSNLVAIHEHGEIGPMLTRKKDTFTTLA